MIFKALKRIFRMTAAAQQMTAWRVYCLKEPAFKKGMHINLKAEIRDMLASNEADLIAHMIKPVEEGGAGYYKVLFYASAGDINELAAFNRRIQEFKMRLQMPNVPDFEI